MATLPPERIGELIAPYYSETTEVLLEQLSTYLDLLMKWNARMNLTAICSPEEIVTRHFGESLLVATHLSRTTRTLLDLGSGAGFPGLPVSLVCPEVAVTLAESQTKKSTFLREAVRTLGVACEVWGGRVEEMPGSRLFDVVTLRGVDRPNEALALGRGRVSPGGVLVMLTTVAGGEGNFTAVPGLDRGYLRVLHV